jgi:predicted ATPase
MIQTIQIENFKSVQDLKLDLGRFNVLIGENGCGKSNILEAIAMGAAASADKLDNEFLHSRGVRVTEPRLMRSGFEKESGERDILIKCVGDKESYECNLYNAKNSYEKWAMREQPILPNDIHSFPRLKKEDREKLILSLKKVILTLSSMSMGLTTFLSYSPENSILRKFEDEAQIEPLGIRGEGLFKLITIIAKDKPEQFAKIKENLKLIGWFKDFKVPTDLAFTERRLNIYDKYLAENLQYFSQKSANEGFLFLLFYITLFVSDYTPKFFAIDNIDNALNPKLCEKLITILVQLAKDYDKQTIVTTHNPAVLDGLDLYDDEQRLFVVWRNAVGETKVKRVKPMPTPEGKEPVRLSEAFLNGYIGGLPKNF